MSRRRKHGDSPAPKKTPLQAAAAEECSSVVEPGRRRLRSARGSRQQRVAGEGPTWPGRPREQRPAAAWCSKSDPKERYKTPRRMVHMDLPSVFSSPNDPDGQNDIFWDQNSPMTKQLGKGRKQHIYTTENDEISHIVNRIAPQDEKPTTNSMLGVWIGETAIPCTPSVAKGKSRVKISCTRLKTQNREQELMKLAKQFDKNMEELDVIQERNKMNHDFIQTISETETLNNYKDDEQMKVLCDTIPEIDNAIIKKPMEVNTSISLVDDQNSSQKSFDQNAEAAFNAIFDGSTQKCSGQLSQDLSDAVLNTSNTTCEKRSTLKEERLVTAETQISEKLPSKSTATSSQLNIPTKTQSCVTSCLAKPEASTEHVDTFITNDFEDEWENMLDNEPFVMQTIERPEQHSFLKTELKETSSFTHRNSKSKSGTNMNVYDRLRNAKMLPDLDSKTHKRELIGAGEHRVPQNSNVKSSKLPSHGNKIKYEESFNKIVEDKIQDSAATSNLKKVKEDNYTKFTANASEKKLGLNRRHSNEQENRPVCNQNFKVPGPLFNSATLAHDTRVNNSHQANVAKIGSSVDDWNDPSFANEIIKTCHQLENTWGADDVDDDLLYQACDDIERLTQQDTTQNSKTSKNILEVGNSAKHGARNSFTISNPKSQVVQSNHLNHGSISLQTSPLTNSPQIHKSLKVDKWEVCRNSPSFLNTTTNLTVNSNFWTSNLHVSGNNTTFPKPVKSSTSHFAGSSTLRVNSDMITTCKNVQQLSPKTMTDATQNNLNATARCSKYTFTKMKNSQVLSQLNQSCVIGSMSDTKITQGLKKMRPVSPLFEKPDQQQYLVKYSESFRQSSKEEKEKNRKYSPEEIQRKRQEALVRRMTKAQASFKSNQRT
ncbi:ewing's tumor-associated antigen 1 [Ochotona princeps]|uniref:ewing's tumor-associated antigen 1 n=1 Tax=Ochotona princeps TaxID=9978 RepID=UPI002714EDED|nr:ewing's tumor-associated antigen 1 [Ochotona princeps]